MIVGFAVMFAQVAEFTVGPFWPVTGWFCGLVLAELVLARRGGRLGPPIRLRLAPAHVTALWAITAVLSAALALASVLRSFEEEVALAERGWAVFTLAVVLAVSLLVMGLHRRPLRPGPADLVSAEVAARCRSARLLLAGGTAVAIWSAPGGGWTTEPHSYRSLLGLVLPLLAWIMAVRPWQCTSAGRPPRLRAIGAVLLTPVLAAGWNTAVAASDEPPPPIQPHADAALYARLQRSSDQWELATLPVGRTPGDEWYESGPVLERAAARIYTGEGGRRAGPLAISGDGHHVAYLDSVTHRLVVQDLAQATVRDLTGPLPAHAVPQPHLSHDGRLAALVSATGTELVDTATGARTALPEVRRVLGLGPYGVIGTTGHRALPGAPDTELLTLDARGRERGRAPFDPTLPALATPDGRALVVLADEEAVTMDPRTGRVTDRATLRLPSRYDRPEPLGWSPQGKLAVRVDPRDDDGHYHLVDPATGRSGPMKGIMHEIEDGVFGRIP